MTAKRILHIISRYNGDNPLFDDFVLRIDSSRFENIVCFLRGEAEKPSLLERQGIETIYLERKAEKKRGIKLKTLFTLKRTIQEMKIDLIHCHRHKPMVYGVLASLLAGGRPVVLTVHGRRRTRSLRRRLANRFFLRRVARVISVSEAVRKDILATNDWLMREKVLTVQNGLDYSRVLEASSISKSEARQIILPGHDKAFWFGTVGRLKPVKNQERLIRVFKQVVNLRPGSILLIAGSGPLKERLEALVQSLNLEEGVFLVGYRHDVPEFLRSLDAFVFPSLSEGLGLAMLEAMASELPVIASNIDASQEIMGDVRCGVLVDPEDEKDILYGMIKLRDLDRETHCRLGEQARKRVLESFSIDRMTGEIVDVYDELLAGSPNRRPRSDAGSNPD